MVKLRGSSRTKPYMIAHANRRLDADFAAKLLPDEVGGVPAYGAFCTPYVMLKRMDKSRSQSNGFTTWLAGVCVKSGLACHAKGEFGHNAVEEKVHMHDV